MSTEVNVQLLEEAAFYIDYFTGTLIEDMLVSAIDSNDLERVAEMVANARLEAHRLEYNPDEVADVA